MDSPEIVQGIKARFPGSVSVSEPYPEEVCLEVDSGAFKDICLTLHKKLRSPVMMLFAVDERECLKRFTIHAVFINAKKGQWFTVTTAVPRETPSFNALATAIHSAALFEREIREMFGIEPAGNPDIRRLNLHNEVWPEGNYPLRKDFTAVEAGNSAPEYKFDRVEGEGIFEVPVGPVHAGIIGPGHFRFSVAGEPIINLETRLGFTHRGVEKLFEGMPYADASGLAERVSGDSSFAHSLACVRAFEKIFGVSVPARATYLRSIFLELERMYNHINDIGGMAVDVGFSFPAAYASIVKEAILQLNEKLTGNRYLKTTVVTGGIRHDINEIKTKILLGCLDGIRHDFDEAVKILTSSISFMDRVDTTGVLRRKTAEDLGVLGLAGRASGIALDLRSYDTGPYKKAKFKMAVEQSGDVLARLNLRIAEFRESCRLIGFFIDDLPQAKECYTTAAPKAGSGIGYTEGWRGPVLYWIKTDAKGAIERCKVVDPSFHNWQGLSYAVLGNIIPDFPLCNKSFDLSYSGNDL
ncbi:MAG: NADH-quinone oxidoreductase subunit C [Candidatus Omnitrophica bacterium]|nr:NADH-quinone oxidoreductase subunit C [Candidatus Omnitrophota bacterium]